MTTKPSLVKSMPTALVLCSKVAASLPVSKRRRFPSCSMSAEKPPVLGDLFRIRKGIVEDGDAVFGGEHGGQPKQGRSNNKAPKEPRGHHCSPPEQVLWGLVVFANEDGCAQHRGPKAALVANGRLRDVHSADDFIRDAVNLFFLIERQVRVELHVQCGGEHFRGQLFGVFSGHFFRFTKRVVLGEISVHGFVAWQGEPDAGGDESVRLSRRILADNGKCHLAGLEMLQPFASGNQFAIRWKDGGNADNVAGGDACVAQGQLKTGEPFPMFPDTFREENLLRDKRHGAGFSGLPDRIESKKFRATQT